MNEVAILEDGIELLADSDRQIKHNQQTWVDRAAREWKEITGRDHPGRWDEVWMNHETTHRGPVIEYHDWRVLYVISYKGFFFQRRCLHCRSWSMCWTSFNSNRVDKIENIAHLYKEKQCSRKKCRKAQNV